MFTDNSQFSHFRIIRQLGAGGMGQVYLAEDQKLGREVALKIVTGGMFSDAERQERFNREARMAAKISHPHVMAVYDINSAPITPGGEPVTYLVMEHVNGVPLGDFLTRNRVNLAEAVRLAEKIASGLSAAHQLGIVHRDIKADNILVTAEREPKILDFGLAKPIDVVQWGDTNDVTATVSKDLTRAGKIIGTVSYMSPEQARGEAVDTRSDVFSFGVLLYRMATGSLPFEGPTQVSTLAKILESQPEQPRQRNAQIPPELERIIDKTLKKSPADRYQNTQDLVVDLRNLRKQYDSGVTDTVSIVTTAAKPEKSRPSAFVSIVKIFMIGLVAIVAIAGILELIGGPDTGSNYNVEASENRVAIAGFDNKTGNAELDWLETGLPEILLTDLGEQVTLEVLGPDHLRDHLVRTRGDENGTYSVSDLREAAVALGAKTVISGSFYQVDTLIRIDARLEDPQTGRIKASEKVQGFRADPFSLIDSLSGKVLASLNVAQSGGSAVGDLLSSSPEAFRAYLDGMKLLGEAREEEAAPLFERALALDSTFALAHMRLGMANIFSGKQQIGARSIVRAKSLESKLSTRERNRLDIYNNVWVRRSFDQAFTQQETFVNTYPDDKEGLLIYGLLLWEFRRDTTNSRRHVDSALALDPNYLFGLSLRVQVLSGQGKYVEAIAEAERFVDLAGESVDAHLRVGNLYQTSGNRKKAVEVFRETFKKFPDESSALLALSRVHTEDREFDSAAWYLDRLEKLYGNDPFKLIDLYSTQANLSVWKGNLAESLDRRRKAIEAARKFGDSTITGNALRGVAVQFDRFEMPDSAARLLFESYRLLPVNGRIGIPVVLSSIDNIRYADTARAMFAIEENWFKRNVPNDLWPIADALKEMLEGNIANDTARVVAAVEQLLKNEQNQPTSQNHWELASVLTEWGKHERAEKMLLPFVVGSQASANAYISLMAEYYLGRCAEGLGRKSDAVKRYENMLRYWGEADIQFKEIRDAKSRLARLRT